MIAEPRVAVSEGLRRVVARGAWPAERIVTFQNLLLDECGGDARPLVALLLRGVEQGIPDDLAGLPAVEWESRRSQLVTRMTANAFVQPEMARWVVTAWGYAMGVVDSPAEASALPDNAPAGGVADPNRQWVAATAAATRLQPAAPVVPPRRRFMPALHSSWTPSATPLSPVDRRRDRVTLAVVLLILIGAAVPAMVAARRHAPQMAAEVRAYTAKLRAGAGGTPLRADGGFSGTYRVERTLESVTGDPSCADGSAAVRWPVPTVETIAHDSASGTFQFLSRPEVRGRVSALGEMEAGPIYGRKDGIDYAFSMVGRFTADGFEARAQTTTRAVISWLTVEHCRLTGRLAARRIG